MPDREVKTIRHLIYFQYSKIIAKAAFGPDAKKTSYGFIKKTFHDFLNDEKHWSDIIREDKQFIQSEKKCIYCGSEENLSWDHIVPKSLVINENCENCDKIQGVHNLIWACKKCNSEKGTKGLYQYFHDKHPEDQKFFDHIPALLEKKYLKTIYYCHICNGTIDNCDFDGDNEISVLDLDISLTLRKSTTSK
jgi:hypothetical protein